MPVELDLSNAEHKLLELGRKIRPEEDAKELRKDLVKHLREAANPARQAVRDSIRAMTSSGHPGRSLRSAVAAKIRVLLKTSGKNVGVKIAAGKTPNIRGFANAPKRLNSDEGWDHPVFGSGHVHRNGKVIQTALRTVHQVGKPGWFDDTLRERKPEFKRSVVDAMEETAHRIARRI